MVFQVFRSSDLQVSNPNFKGVKLGFEGQVEIRGVQNVSHFSSLELDWKTGFFVLQTIPEG